LDLKQLRQPLTILATADEESSMAGARALRDSGRALGVHALIGEPTGMQPVTRHKGILIECIELIGQSGHSSDPSLGNNALEGMNRVMNQLLEWRTELQSTHRDDAFRVPVPTMNLGAIHGGDNPNRICARCELSLDIRLLPDMPLDETRQVLHERVRQAINGTGLELRLHGRFAGIEGMHTDAGADIVKLTEQLTGNAATTVAFGTEGPFLNAMGMQTVILGPGDIDVAHQANEYVDRKRLDAMQLVLQKLIQHFCLPA
ncbi:MAG: M20/M25/M40 family metallo-hydrolase, partial [Thiotrichales bacterium]|nr:M20/M25/M40 family metallo-hydrolase [Thiotrichales bacterium]